MSVVVRTKTNAVWWTETFALFEAEHLKCGLKHQYSLFLTRAEHEWRWRASCWKAFGSSNIVLIRRQQRLSLNYFTPSSGRLPAISTCVYVLTLWGFKSFSPCCLKEFTSRPPSTILATGPTLRWINIMQSGKNRSNEKFYLYYNVLC